MLSGRNVYKSIGEPIHFLFWNEKQNAWFVAPEILETLNNVILGNEVNLNLFVN